MSTLTKKEIITALQRLGELAEQQGEAIELLLLGGAAIVLMYETRLATHDVDVLILAPQTVQIVRQLAKQVANEYNFSIDWLNDGAKGYLIGISYGETIFSAPGIVIKTPSIAQLLAMKLSAWRDDVDIADASQLLRQLTGGYEVIWQSVQPYLVPGAELKAQYAFLDLWESLYGST